MSGFTSSFIRLVLFLLGIQVIIMIFQPLAVFMLVMKNTIIWGLANTGMVGYLTVQSITLFISATIFGGLYTFVRPSNS